MFLAIKECLMVQLIAWPMGNRSKEVMCFQETAWNENVIGAIDGSHIAIKAPREHQTDYIKRKGFHSVILQAVCDHQLLFTNCFVGWPGSVHDARVFRNSQIFQAAQTRYSTLFPMNSYLVGDAAYPLSRFVLTPFRDTGHLSNKIQNYNYLYSVVN